MKTSELVGAALDWAVAKAEGHEIDSLMGGAVWYWRKCSLTGSREVVELFRPSTNDAQGGPIIEREGISLDYAQAEDWGAKSPKYQWAYGPTHLVAAMRCYVASKLGDTVDIPEELI